MFDVIIGVVIGARPVGRGVVSQPSRFVTVEVKPVAPGEARNAGPGGAVGAAEEGETKRRDGWSTAACDGGTLAPSARTGGCDGFIDREVRQCPGNKSGAEAWPEQVSAAFSPGLYIRSTP